MVNLDEVLYSYGIFKFTQIPSVKLLVIDK